jgi:hypothetical protein
MTLEDLDKWDAELVRVEQIERRSSFVIGVSAARDLLRLARERLGTAAKGLPERYHKGYPRIPGGDWSLDEPMVDKVWLEGVLEILAALKGGQ